MDKFFGEYEVRFEAGTFSLPEAHGEALSQKPAERLLLRREEGADTWRLCAYPEQKVIRLRKYLPRSGYAFLIGKPVKPPWEIVLPAAAIEDLNIADGDILVVVGLVDEIEITEINNYKRLMEQCEQRLREVDELEF